MEGKPVEITESAAADIAALQRPFAEKVANKIAQLGKNPKLGEALRGDLSDYSKLRFSSFRVVYREYPDKIVVIAAGARKDKEIYDLALSRVLRRGEVE